MNLQLAVFLKRAPIRKPAGVAEQHSCGNALVARVVGQICIIRVFRQRLWQILIDRLVQIQDSFAYQFHRQVRERHLGKRSCGHHRVHRQRQILLFVPKAIGFQMSDLPVIEDRNSHACDLRGLHQPRHCAIEFR